LINRAGLPENAGEGRVGGTQQTKGNVAQGSGQEGKWPARKSIRGGGGVTG